MEAVTLNLENFEGPVELLYHLVQKKELDIYGVPLLSVVEQFLSHQPISLEIRADFLGCFSSLLLWKSRALLPKDGEPEIKEAFFEDPKFEVIYHLIDYCKFKQAAKLLSERQEKCLDSFGRGVTDEVAKNKPLGIDHLSLEDLASLFEGMLAKVSSRTGFLHDEDWKVSDKITELRALMNHKNKIAFEEFFYEDTSKGELVASFLAVLEMMKLGEIYIIKEEDLIRIVKIL